MIFCSTYYSLNSLPLNKTYTIGTFNSNGSSYSKRNINIQFKMEDNNKENLKEDKKKINIKLKTIIIICVIIAVVILGVIVYASVVHNQGFSSGGLDYPPGVKKPIIYLYPEETTELSVKLGKSENITCSYPKYNNGWNVIANTDGTLIDKNTGRKLYSLYWEGIQSEPIN